MRFAKQEQLKPSKGGSSRCLVPADAHALRGLALLHAPSFATHAAWVYPILCGMVPRPHAGGPWLAASRATVQGFDFQGTGIEVHRATDFIIFTPGLLYRINENISY